MKTKEENDKDTEAWLTRVLALQAGFKHKALIRMTCAVVKAALEHNGDGLWPDDDAIQAEVAKLPMDDRKCVGTAWKWAQTVGLISRGGEHRRSTAGPSKGREIAIWHVADRRKAEVFLSRNKAAFESAQRELF